MNGLTHTGARFVAGRSRGPAHGSTDGTATPVLSVVIPLYDEELNFPTLLKRLREVLSQLTIPCEMIFVNDGSRDRTGVLLDLACSLDPSCVAIHLSRNFGHQAAVQAGLENCLGQAVVVLDGDLQDPPELIPELLHQWRAGAEVVYAVRASRQEGPALRLAYRLFYWLLNRWADFPIPRDAGDCCLMDRRVVDVLTKAAEQPRFLRGLRAYAGFRQAALPYDRCERHAGRSKYTLRKLLSLALDGFFSCTKAPVQLLWLLTSFSLVAFFLIVFYAVAASQQASWLAIGLSASCSAILLALAIVGEYLARIFRQVQQRPSFLVRDVRRGGGSLSGVKSD